MEDRKKYDVSYYKQVVAEQKREISRLQKLLAKAEVKLQSEVAKVRAQEFEKYAKKCLQITPDISQEEAARRYQEHISGGKE